MGDDDFVFAFGLGGCLRENFCFGLDFNVGRFGADRDGRAFKTPSSIFTAVPPVVGPTDGSTVKTSGGAGSASGLTPNSAAACEPKALSSARDGAPRATAVELSRNAIENDDTNTTASAAFKNARDPVAAVAGARPAITLIRLNTTSPPWRIGW